jgi:arylsulfatase A-like enzyme
MFPDDRGGGRSHRRLAMLQAAIDGGGATVSMSSQAAAAAATAAPAAAAAATNGGEHHEQQPSAHRRPNIVLVLTDDQGYGELGCHGNPLIQTPAIDALHADDGAVRFTDFHVGTTCAPTRAGLLTGHFCNSAGVWHTIGGRSLLREDEWTLPAALASAGYRCAHFGKW